MTTQNIARIDQESMNYLTARYNVLSGLLANSDTPEGMAAINDALPTMKGNAAAQKRVLQKDIDNCENQITALGDAVDLANEAGVSLILRYLDTDMKKAADGLNEVVDTLFEDGKDVDEDSPEWVEAHNRKMELTARMLFLHAARIQITASR